jgi:hypothetical protein
MPNRAGPVKQRDGLQVCVKIFGRSGGSGKRSLRSLPMVRPSASRLRLPRRCAPRSDILGVAGGHPHETWSHTAGRRNRFFVWVQASAGNIMTSREPPRELSPRERAARPSGGMADAGDLKSPAREGVWVQIPSGPVKNAGSEPTARNLVCYSHSEAKSPPALQLVVDRWPAVAPAGRLGATREVCYPGR